MGIIELEHLTKTYGGYRGVEDLSFAVEEGEIFGVVGPGGAGKSTAIRAMLDLVHPTSGTAKLFGLDSRAQGKKLRAEVGYVPSKAFYCEDLRVRDLLRYSAGFYHKNCKARIRALADELELDLGRRIGELSCGNRKKVGIVQGLLHAPRLLLLDEPMAGLEAQMRQKLFGLLRRENQRGVTILFSSRMLSEAQRLCGRVAILREGRLAELRTAAELREQSCCRVRAEGPGLSAEAFRAEGVAGLTVDENGAEFLWRGTPGRLVEALRGVDMVNLWISEPTSEEVFLHYGKGGDGA